MESDLISQPNCENSHELLNKFEDDSLPENILPIKPILSNDSKNYMQQLS